MLTTKKKREKVGKRKIKICFISSAAYPLFNPKCHATFGGAEVDLYLLSKELAKDKNFDVSFIVGDFGQKDKEIKKGVKIFKNYKFNENKIYQMSKLLFKIKEIDANIYFQESASGSTGIISYFCKKKNKIFLYRTASDIDCNGTFIKKNKIEGALYRYGIKNSSKIITQNEKNKQQLFNSLSLDSEVVRNISVKLKLINHQKGYILWVGRSEKLKNPELFLELAKNFPKEKFVMIAPKTIFSNKHEIEIKAKKIKNMRFIHYVPFNLINKYFENAKILINTSDYEGFPNTFVQATSNSVPIISLNVNPDNFLSTYNCGFCAKGDFELMKKQIKRLLKDKKLYEKMSKNAYRYAKNNHDVKRIISEYKKIIKELVNKKLLKKNENP